MALADPDADTSSLRSACEQALHLGDQQGKLIDALLTLATSEGGVERGDTFDLADITEYIVAGRRHEAEQPDLRINATLISETCASYLLAKPTARLCPELAARSFVAPRR